MEKVQNTQNQAVNDKARLTRAETLRRAAIGTAVEVESTFKLYSYRIVSHEDFTARMLELAHALIKVEKEQDDY